jgi:hypothetical protein
MAAGVAVGIMSEIPIVTTVHQRWNRGAWLSLNAPGVCAQVEVMENVNIRIGVVFSMASMYM